MISKANFVKLKELINVKLNLCKEYISESQRNKNYERSRDIKDRKNGLTCF